MGVWKSTLTDAYEFQSARENYMHIQNNLFQPCALRNAPYSELCEQKCLI